MDLFEKIFSIAESTELLEQFVSNNINSIDDFHNTEYFSMKNFKTSSIEKFILLKYSIIEKLDYSKSYNKAFISILLEFSERFNLICLQSFLFLFQDCQKSKHILQCLANLMDKKASRG